MRVRFPSPYYGVSYCRYGELTDGGSRGRSRGAKGDRDADDYETDEFEQGGQNDYEDDFEGNRDKADAKRDAPKCQFVQLTEEQRREGLKYLEEISR